jgi:pyruvate/2-oxoglutarate dehydrogenase complex dihydrolipoamide dehydrogenase (E3) component
MTATSLTPTLCIIGAGTGGLSVAAAAAVFGVPVVLIDQGNMGGEHLSGGYVRSKALLAAARRFADLKSLPDFGISVDGAKLDFAKVRAHLQGAVAAVALNDTAQRYGGLGVQVIKGTARFTDADTVTVGDTTFKAAHYVIATGSSPANPLIPGLDSIPALTSETIFDLTQCPEHLLVIGGGTTGVELAQAYRRFGAAVTLIEARDVLGSDDPECVDVVLAALARDGITIHANTAIRQVSKAGAKISVTLETADGVKTVEGSHLLIAAGRRPNIDGLNLAAAGITFNANGVIVNPQLRTSNKKVYAIGEAAGGPHFTHAAGYHAGIVIKNALFRLPAKVDLRVVPRVTFSDPEFASVGLSDAEATRIKADVRILRASYHDNDRAKAERATHGHIKVLTDTGGTVLGATIVGENASELITSWTLAVSQRLNIKAMAELVVPSPTFSEVGKRAAITYFTPGLRSSLLQRILAFLRRGG